MHLVPGSLRLVNKIGGKMATGKYKTREIQLTGRESGRVELHVWLSTEQGSRSKFSETFIIKVEVI